MNQRYLQTILFIFSFCCAYSQEQTPSIEWIESYPAGNRGGSITAFQGPNILFALTKAQNSISGSASISKFYADGLVKNQYIITDGGSGNAPFMSQYASQDGGVLVFLVTTQTLRRYDASLDLSWQKNINYFIKNATATLANGFYILSTSYVNNQTISEIKRLRNDGEVEWSVNTTGFAGEVNDIQTSSDDGVIIVTTNGLRKYSANGQLIWANTNILGGYQLIPTDPSVIYLLTSNANLNVRNVVQLNTSTGTMNWSATFNNESITDFERTSDNGFVVSTNTGLYKYSSTGTQQWKNTSFSSAGIATTFDQKIFVLKNNTITKLGFSNEQLWTKSFNRDYYVINDLVGASDFGLYVTAVKSGIYFNNSPDFLLFKLASPDTPCKTNIDIIGESATFCKTGNLGISSRLSNVQMEYISYLTDVSFEWQKNNVPIESANSYSYTAKQSGNYNLKVRQQSCEAFSRSIELNIVNETPPTLEVERSQICAGTSVYLTAKGCNGTVVWSTGQRASQILVTPQATTAYNAFCENYFNNQLCQSPVSNNLTITVLSSSNLRIDRIDGKREFCESGSTVLKPVVSGGIPPLSYVWGKKAHPVSDNPNFSVSEEGEYTLHIVDNIGCFVESEIVQIRKTENPAPPTINSISNNILCYPGSLTITTDTQENSYQWVLNDFEIPDAVNASYPVANPGNYHLKVTNTNGCSSISRDTIKILASDLRLNRIDGKKEFCDGSSTELSPTLTGGVEPFNYEWKRNNVILSQNNKLLVKDEGIYFIMVTDKAGCSIQSNPIIIQKFANPPAPEISSPSGTEICADGKAVLTTAVKAFGYQWYVDNQEIDKATDQFYTATKPGKYVLIIRDSNGCSNISENRITISQIIIPQPTIRQSNDSLISSAATGNKWYLNGNELALTSQKIKFTEVGNYQVKVFEKGCESLPSAVFQPVLLANEPETSYIKVYPNPSADKVFISSPKMFSYKLVDASGKLLKQSHIKQNTHIIELMDFAGGSYFIAFEEENGKTMTTKIIVNR